MARLTSFRASSSLMPWTASNMARLFRATKLPLSLSRIVAVAGLGLGDAALPVPSSARLNSSRIGRWKRSIAVCKMPPRRSTCSALASPPATSRDDTAARSATVPVSEGWLRRTIRSSKSRASSARAWRAKNAASSGAWPGPARRRPGRGVRPGRRSVGPSPAALRRPAAGRTVRFCRPPNGAAGRDGPVWPWPDQ